MFYGTYDEKVGYINRLIEDYKITAGLFPLVRHVVDKFDGKVFNCRFEKALQETLGFPDVRIYAKKDSYNLSVYWYSKNCNNYMTIASVLIKELEDKKRINAEKLLESARNIREKNLKHAVDLERELPNVELYQARINEIRKQLSNLVDGLPYELADTFGLRARVTTC